MFDERGNGIAIDRISKYPTAYIFDKADDRTLTIFFGYLF